MDLIDRQAAIEKTDMLFKELSKDYVDMMGIGYNHAVADAIAIIKCLPPAEKHGKWVKDEQESLKHIEAIYICSACNNFEAWGETEKYNYCPNCGARMDLENEDE